MSQNKLITLLIEEFKPAKKDNKIIIFTFALSLIVMVLGITISPNSYIVILMLILSLSLLVVVFMMISWKILRLLRELDLFGVNQPFNDF